MHAYVDVDMQVWCIYIYIFMHVSAYACMRMHGMHIPLAGPAHQGGYLGGGTNPERWHIHKYIYMYMYKIYRYIYIYIYDVYIPLDCYC